MSKQSFQKLSTKVKKVMKTELSTINPLKPTVAIWVQL